MPKFELVNVKHTGVIEKGREDMKKSLGAREDERGMEWESDSLQGRGPLSDSRYALLDFQHLARGDCCIATRPI